MTQSVEDILAEQGLVLPPAPPPAANYAPWVVDRGYVYISGQLPMVAGTLVGRGQVGVDLTLEEGEEAARVCTLNILAQLKAACEDDLSQVRACLKLGGFVCCAPDFSQHPRVIDAASALIVAIWGTCGRHARFAVGCASLPLGAAVEIEAVFALHDPDKQGYVGSE